MNIDILSNFSAQCIKAPLERTATMLGWNATIQVGPFDQVVQGLISYRMPSPADRWLLILVQVERWLSAGASAGDAFAAHSAALVRGAESIAHHGYAIPLVCLCPSSPQRSITQLGAEAEAELAERLIEANVDVVRRSEFATARDAGAGAEMFNDYLDEIAAIPYSDWGAALIATVVARRMTSIMAPPRKVLVVDCDDTLWAGVCGEDGSERLEISAERRRLHAFLVRQVNAGRLLCICSKNNEADVLAVFDQRKDLGIRREHVVAWKINWRPKPDNLAELAHELNLALSSFIFIDNDAFECQSVDAIYPEVLILQLPSRESEIMPYLENIWELDLPRTSAEDAGRTAFYQSTRARETLRSQAISLDDYVASLELRVSWAVVTPATINRASQLTLRTNQFNLNGVKRSAVEIRAAIAREGTRSFLLSAADRFGEYGIVGFALLRVEEFLHVDSLVLSCRALGRGVEARLAGMIASHSRECGCNAVRFAFQDTGRNAVCQQFLEMLPNQTRLPDGSYLVTAKDLLDGAIFNRPIPASNER